MKMFFFCLLILTQNLWADQIYRDQAGFPICYEKNKDVYFFDCDCIIKAQSKYVFYYKLSDYIQ